MHTKFKALATSTALDRLYQTMPPAAWDALEERCMERGESIPEAIGRIAVRGDRWVDVELVPVYSEIQ